MNLKTIQENIQELACEDMTEDGIHHDDWVDHEWKYIEKIVSQLVDMNEIEELPIFEEKKRALLTNK